MYRECDLATLEDRLVRVMDEGGLGTLDGNEVGQGVVTLFLYGPDGERLFSGIEATLRAYPLCQGARVEIRRGADGSLRREVRL